MLCIMGYLIYFSMWSIFTDIFSISFSVFRNFCIFVLSININSSDPLTKISFYLFVCSSISFINIPPCLFFFFMGTLFICLFIYLFLSCWVFVAACGLSFVVASRLLFFSFRFYFILFYFFDSQNKDTDKANTICNNEYICNRC